MTHFVPETFEYDKARIYRRLKITADPSVLEYTEKVFPSLEAAARQELELLLCYTVVPNDLELGSPELDSCEKLAICYCGCSERIVARITAMMDEGLFLEGYVLNDLSNEILFNASEAMNGQIYRELRRQGYHLSTRFSPGENHLSMEHQAVFLTLLKREEDLPVALTEQYMLSPEKAMLYAYGAGSHLPDRPVEHNCAACPNVDCYLRVNE